MRLFVSIDLAIPVVDTLVLLQEDLNDPIEDLGLTPRWTAAPNLHLTLRFLGETDAALVYRVRDSLRRVGEETPFFDLQTYATGVFPAPDKPRIVWAGVGEGSEPLEALRGRIEAGFAELGIEADRRPYHPHVTIGRMKTDGNRADIGAVLAPYAETDFGRTQVKDFVLIQSQLHRKGPIYKVVERFPLIG